VITTRLWREKSRNCLHLRECENVQQMTTAQVCAISKLEETRQSTELSSIGYAAIVSSLYKRRRLHQPSLPSSIDAVADAIRNSKICFAAWINFLPRPHRRRPIYWQNPLLAHSTYATKFHCLQIPTSAKNWTLQSKSNTCKFQDGRFTAKIHYLQFQLLANSYNPVEQGLPILSDTE